MDSQAKISGTSEGSNICGKPGRSGGREENIGMDGNNEDTTTSNFNLGGPSVGLKEKEGLEIASLILRPVSVQEVHHVSEEETEQEEGVEVVTRMDITLSPYHEG